MNPPVLHEHESERSYLSHLLIKGAAGGTDFGLAEEDFHNQLHRKIFASILEITDKGIAVDPISLTNQLRETGRFS
ncbi:MAG TPA: DnaB-like helicase N-terminal domain-containing protein, partial [Leptospiraceae bacterium]|nr:DnaB-like helicase N-terminal domain-containing protein [Leptospiraceae bacterium]